MAGQSEGKTYFVSVPNDVLYDDLYPQAYRIAALITNMSYKTGYIWAENKWLAEKFNISERTVSRSVSQLVKKGHYSRYIDRNDNNKRYLSPLPESRLIMLINNKYHPTSIDKSVHTSIDTAVGETDKPGQICPPSLDKSGVSINRMKYKTDEEREPLSLDDLFEEKTGLELRAGTAKGLTKTEQARFSFLTARLSADLPEEFFVWFEIQVLGRFDVMCVSAVDLADWHRHLWEKYGESIATDAISDRRANTKSSHPNLGEVKKLAAVIDGDIKRQKREAAAAIRRKEECEKAMSDVKKPKSKPITLMSIEELEKELKKFEGSDNKFMIERIQRKLNEKRPSPTRGGCRISNTENGLMITCSKRSRKPADGRLVNAK